MCLLFQNRGWRPDSRWIVCVALLALGGRAATAQSVRPDGRTKGATVSGGVFDSLSRRALVGAVVQLVATDGLPHPNKTATSDATGWYEIGDVPTGVYAIGFLHPTLDSLGVDAPLRSLTVSGADQMRADLGTASPATLRHDVCGTRSAAQAHADSGALVLGIVRDAATRAPIANASVAAEWRELSFTKDGPVPHRSRIVAKSAENGWFALCDVPSIGTFTVTANYGAGSTAEIEWRVPANGFLRGDLYVGAARAVTPRNVLRSDDSTSPPPPVVYSGNGRLFGRVVASGDQPIAGARVNLADGPRTQTDAGGRWTLAEAPTGTWMLEVRAISFLPSRTAVHVLDGADSVRVELLPVRTFLDTVKVTAARTRSSELLAFDERRRSGLSMGRFLTAADIARRSPSFASDMFRYISGVHVEGSTVTVRGAFGRCVPSLWLDGQHVGSAGDIDDVVSPAQIAGIEVYFDQVPPMFQRGMAGCGSIVVWRK